MKVVFLCTANSARSILAEGIFKHLVGNHCDVYSCGSRPSGRVNPFALQYLRHHGIETSGFTSKDYSSVPLEGALLVAVCNNAANEVCPVVGGRVHQVSMPLEDPGAPGLSREEQQLAFDRVGEQLWLLLENLKDQVFSKSTIQSIVSPSDSRESIALSI